MYTCKRCGANALDARGLCHNCGWQATANDFYANDDAPSLGETRAAEAPFTPSSLTSQATRIQGAMQQGPVQGAPGPQGIPGIQAPQSMQGQGQGQGQGRPRPMMSGPIGGAGGTRIMTPPPLPPTRGPRSASNPQDGLTNTPLFCGTCGARLEDGQAFCGQCGSQVDQGGRGLAARVGAGATIASPPPLSNGVSAPLRYRVGEEHGWEGDNDAPTEMFTEAAPARSAYGGYSVYGQAGARSHVATPPAYGSRRYEDELDNGDELGAPAAHSTRTTKIVFGVLCLLGSLITAVAAIVLALLTFH